MRRNVIETALGDHKKRAATGWRQSELHECRLLFRVIDLRIHAIGMPRKGEQALRRHFLHRGLPHHVLVTWMGDAPAGYLPRHEWPFQVHAKPFAELPVVR